MTEFQTILDDFEFLDDWDDRYKYLIDLGRALPPFPEQNRNDDFKVRGCASQVWLVAETDGETLKLQGDSDAHIVKGLVAVLLALFDGKKLSEAKGLDVQAALAPLDLADHLTPQRSNGLAAMIKRIGEISNAA
ncbi:MAG: SufE family protein [Pseudomonadota bacterium]